MMASKDGDQWKADAVVLARIGAALMTDVPVVKVIIPEDLAAQAVAAWEREDEGPVGIESEAERMTRQRAGSLALIGLTISECGRKIDAGVEVELSAWFVGNALDAADDIAPLDQDQR